MDSWWLKVVVIFLSRKIWIFFWTSRQRTLITIPNHWLSFTSTHDPTSSCKWQTHSSWPIVAFNEWSLYLRTSAVSGWMLVAVHLKACPVRRTPCPHKKTTGQWFRVGASGVVAVGPTCYYYANLCYTSFGSDIYGCIFWQNMILLRF